MTTTTYRNDTTGYVVTLIDNDRGGARVTDSLGYNFPMDGADYPHAAALAARRAHRSGAALVPQVATPAPLASPLAPETQVRSARPLAAGTTLTMPTLPQARCLLWSVGITPGVVADGTPPVRPVKRGYASVDGRTAPLTVLQAMARRGWLQLDHPIRPTQGTVTKAGHLALLAYVTKHGEVL